MNTAPSATSDDSRLPQGWRWAPAWVLAYVAFWPASRISEAILSLGAITALVILLKARFRGGARLLSHSAWALTTALFFCYWLPQLVSSVDAFDVSEALRKSASALRYLPFLWLVAIAVATGEGQRKVFSGIAIIMTVWALDLWMQGLSEGRVNFLYGMLDGLYQMIRGQAMCHGQELRGFDRHNGIFGPCNPILGVVLASFSPFVLLAAARRMGAKGWMLAAAIIGMAVFWAGSRASWLGYALVLLLTGWQVLGWKKLLGFSVAGLALAAALLVSPFANERLERTARLFSGDVAGADVALSGRMRIWGSAVCMVETHPINGVGVRGFRHAWDDCDPVGKVACTDEDCPAIPAPEWGEGPALHAHQLVLEILSETGFFGLLLWLAGAALAWRAWHFANVSARERARPAMLALVVTTFPLNTHLAFYSSAWGAVFLLLVALYAGSLLARDENQDLS
ncbi:hypothetical protein CO608_08030 [Lysobacteraceae bacterium NML08-0793]|nr:hypothetical protein CO608_08030 [Xanthomonadaceae bacterium NML08-0793]